MGIDFSDLIPAKPQANSSASGGISFDDLIPKQADAASPAASTPMPATLQPQPQLAADLNAVGQGLVSGAGAVVAGAGRLAQAGTGPDASRMLAALDQVDQGKNVEGYGKLTDAQRMQVASYRRGGPDDRQAQRDALQQTIDDYTKPNTLTSAGMAVERAAPSLFPVDPANEGIQTGVGRMIGGAAPALAAGAIEGPPGVLAAMAVIGSQAYDGAYQDAIAKRATHAVADDAAGKSALAQAATMVFPVSRMLKLVPVPLRDGLTATLVNLGKHGVEFGSGNALGTFAQNYVAQQTYDPERPLMQGTGQAGLEGMIAGLIIRGAATEVGAARAGLGPRAPAATISDIGNASSIDGAIAAAGEAAQTPPTNDTAAGAAPGGTAGSPANAGATQPATAWGDLFAPLATDTAGAAPGAPQSAGAAASRDLTHPNVADISTADMKANRRRAEMDELLAPPQSNDTMIHVPGSFPTLAERSGDPKLSQYENLLRQRVPDAFIGEGKILTESNKARVAEYDNNTIPDTTLNTMRANRAARWNAASGDILPTAKRVDLTPVLDWVQEQLSNPRIQENDAVRGVLENFQDRIVDDGGNLKTDPAAVWGIHDNLQNQLARAKDPLNMTGAEKFAEGQILQAKGLIDQAMNKATDNRFQSALDGYAQDSKAINAGVLLNDFRPKLTNMGGELQAAAFHRFVVNLAKERGDPGIDPSMDISDQAMRSLMNIDADLKRAGLIKLGAAAGSPTNLLGALADRAGLEVAQKVASAIPGLSAAISPGLKFLADRKFEKDAARHIAPPDGGYSYPELPEPESFAPAPPPGGGRPGSSGSPGPLFSASPPSPAAPPAAPSPPAGVPPTPAVAAAGRATTRAGGAGPGESVAFTPSGQAVAVRYTARDASNLIASQLSDGRTNPAYPAALQPRDRTRAASIQQVTSIANRLQPERLGASASTSEGAPIIGPDGAVESGNGRTMAIMQAYADGGPLADAYRQWVSAQGHDTSGMQNPILVRERLGDLDLPARARLAADMGASPIAAMSAPERAAADARAIPVDILSMYQGGDVTLAKNAPFARAFAEHVIPPGEQSGFMTADGEMSADGAIRMRNALTQHAYGSNSLVISLAENADPDIKAFGGAMMDAAGEMAKLRGAIDSGTAERANDIAPDIVAAAQLIQTARRQRISLADAVGQRDAFSVLPSLTETILQSAFGDDYAGRMSRSRMADLLSTFAKEARMQNDMFGANLTAGEMLAEARAKYGYGTNKAGNDRGGTTPVGNGPGLDLNRPRPQR